MAIHPPAMGGKTAWGVGDVAAVKQTDDPNEIIRTQKAQAEFEAREEARLQRLKAMENDAGNISANRAARRQAFQPEISKGVDDFKKRQDEILKKMEEAKLQRRMERNRKKEAEGGGKNKKKKKKKKKKDSSSSDSDSDSNSDSDDSSGSGKKKAAKQEEPQVSEAVAAANAAALAAAQQRALEAKVKEREVKRKAKEQLQAWEAEQAKKKLEEEAKRKAEAKKREEEAEAKKKEEAKKKAEEEAKKKEEAEKTMAEAESKTSAEAEKRKALFAASTGRVSRQKAGQGGAKVAGGYKVGEYVQANQDITVRGNLVVRNGTTGTVKGPAETDPIGRLAVEFTTRADGLNGVLNVVPREIKKG